MAGEGMRAEPPETQPQPIQPQPPLAAAAQAALAHCEERLAALEKTVKIHDKTIKRGIELAASYLNNEIHQPQKPSNDTPQSSHAASR